MIVKLIPAADVQPGMFIDGNPGWYPITEMNSLLSVMAGQEFVRNIHVHWTNEDRMACGRIYPTDSHILVGVPETTTEDDT